MRFRNRLGRLFPAPVPAGATTHSRRIRRMAWVGAAAAALVAGIFWLASPGQLNADQVLDRAIRNESRTVPKRRVLRIESAGSVCQWNGDLGLASNCGGSRERLLALHWDTQDPLSARAFRRWHGSLRSKRDRIEEGGGRIRLATQTETDTIQLAAVLFDAASYRVVRLRLEPRSQPPIEISEQDEAIPMESVAAALPEPVSKPVNRDAESSQAMAQTEVEVWEVLGRAGLLDGWSAGVERDARGINVVLMGGTETTQRNLVATLSSAGRVAVEVPDAGAPVERMQILPAQRDASTGNPPLGEKWLTQPYPGDADQLTNRVLSDSRRALGYSSIAAVLARRKSELAACPCANRLDPWIAASNNSTSSSLAELSSALAPLFDNAAAHPVHLNTKQVRELDTSLLHVFSAAGDLPLAEELTRIRGLLGFTADRQ